MYGLWLSGKCRRGRGKKYKGARAAHVGLWGARRSRPSSSESADGGNPWRGSAAGTHRSEVVRATDTVGNPRRLRRGGCQHHWDKLVELCEEGLPSFLGKTLERWFISSYLESGQWSPVGSWWDNKGLHEIDLIAVDETNKQIVFGEAKLNPEKYDKKKLEQSSQAFLSQHKKYADYSKKLVGLFPENM